MTDFPPIGHVAVTVKDLAVSRPWYQRLTGADPVLDEPTDAGFHHTVFMMGGTLLGLHQHPKTDTDATFTELRPGLDHIAFACPDRTALTSWQTHLDNLDIPHGGIIDADYGSGLSFKDPDGIALEFFAPPN
ncbi:MAG TPA: VOC family protein [Egibacteraceae bacterium]|jgi:glyoxylase I family protein|nr:VOC family protein [Egibacteraceae bacterium]